MQAAIYCRVSTDEQAEQGFSIPAQKSRLESFCKAQGWDIYSYYIDDGYSGKDLDRPAMQNLIKDAMAGCFNVVVVYKLDRISRRQKDVLYLLEDLFIPRDIGFKSATEPFETTTPFGRAALSMMAVFGQLERETIVERTKMGIKEVVRQGRFAGGPIPYGYDHNPETKSLTVNALQAETIRLIYDIYLKGIHGIWYISDLLNKKGTPWHNGNAWRQVDIRRILKNPLYAGMVIHYNDVYKGRHEGIVSVEQWEKAQEIMSGRTHRFNRVQVLLSGLIYCGECGARMRVKRRGPHPRYKGQYCYVCYSHDKCNDNMVRDEHCQNGRAWLVEKINKSAVDKILAAGFSDENLNSAIEDSSEGDLVADYKTIAAQVKREFSEVERKLNRWYVAFEKGALDPEGLTDRVKELKKTKKYLEDKLKEIEGSAEVEKQKRVDRDNIKRLIKEFPALWTDATYEEQRSIIGHIVERVIVYKDGSIEVKFNVN